jgi:hypothetical protein
LDTAFGGVDKQDSDGSAYVICAIQSPDFSPDRLPHLYILDYGVEQITGALLDSYLERISKDVDDWAVKLGSRFGVLPTYIEEKASGIVLLQQAARAGLNAKAIPNALVHVGKDGRVLAATKYLNQRQVHMTAYALEKQVQFKGKTANHLIQQLNAYRINDPKRHKRADDLADAFSYSVLLAAGNDFGL